MTINTKQVAGRRAVTYGSLSEYLADVERCATQPVLTFGNWTQAQIYEHLAITLESSIDGAPSVLPAPVRWIMSLLMKNKFLNGTMPAGFKAPAAIVPQSDLALETALADLSRAITRAQSEPYRAIHPAFGKLTPRRE
jgi:hypothetical protein